MVNFLHLFSVSVNCLEKKTGNKRAACFLYGASLYLDFEQRVAVHKETTECLPILITYTGIL